MAYLLYLAIVAVLSNVNGHPLQVQHGSSSYMHQYHEHRPAVPVHLPYEQLIDSTPLVLRAGSLAEPHHVTSGHSHGFLADPNYATNHGHSLAVAAHPFYGQGQSGHHGPVALPVVLPSGYLADTREVAEAKAHHLSAVAQAKADKYYGGQADAAYGGAYGYSGSAHGYGLPVVLPNGHIADTREVAEAKAHHLSAVAQAKADKYYGGQADAAYGGAYGYSGSAHGYGLPVVLPNGHIADTREVAAAKSAHLVAVAHAKARDALTSHDEDEHYHYEHAEPSYESHYDHEGPSYESHYHYDQPQYETQEHYGSEVSYYEPHQELQHEPHKYSDSYEYQH